MATSSSKQTASPAAGRVPRPAFSSRQLRLKAEAVLRRRLEADPCDARTLTVLGDVHRANGNLPAALETYRRVSALRPNWRKAAWLAAMLGGERLPHAPLRGVWPAAFVRIPDFLTHAEHDRVLRFALAHLDRFEPGKVGPSSSREIRTSTRRSFVLSQRACRELEAELVPKVLHVLPDVLLRLRLKRSAPLNLGLELAVYADKGFSKAHIDPSPKAYSAQTPACIYYFHRRPKAFSGGDLLLYDGDVERESFDCGRFTRIEPVANTLVCYPRRYFHEVSPVACSTGKFTDSRFSANFLYPRR